MVSSPIIFSKAPSYLDRIANGTTRALMNTGLSSITRDDTWIYLSFAFEQVSNKLGYCWTISLVAVEIVLKMFCQGNVNLDIMSRTSRDGPWTTRSNRVPTWSRNLTSISSSPQHWIMSPVQLLKSTVGGLSVVNSPPTLEEDSPVLNCNGKFV